MLDPRQPLVPQVGITVVDLSAPLDLPRCTELRARRAEVALEVAVADAPARPVARVRGVVEIRDERFTA
jgi:hypothetical protein